jgi:hypothetical protein
LIPARAHGREQQARGDRLIDRVAHLPARENPRRAGEAPPRVPLRRVISKSAITIPFPAVMSRGTEERECSESDERVGPRARGADSIGKFPIKQ